MASSANTCSHSSLSPNSRRKMALGAAADYDRLKELKEFDDAKLGVRGLVESGVTAIPRFFLHPPENLTALRRPPTTLVIPTIDLSNLNTGRRSTIISQIADAARTWGFFQLTNHGIPISVIDGTISALQSFHEQPAAVRSTYYCRGLAEKDVTYNTNFDLFESKAATWRDTLYVLFSPGASDVEERIPEICRRELVAWDEEVRRVGEVLGEVLSEGLGLERWKLKEMTGFEGRAVVAHYYPYCPEADRTMGNVAHTDPGVVTVLVQNDVEGLEVKHGEEWVQVTPAAGALVVNVGDLLRMISNDEYKSVEHRVLANSSPKPRISIAFFFNPTKRGDTDLYGPLPELLSEDKPPQYRNFTMDEFFGSFLMKGELGGPTKRFKL